jgi:hypothetical protein
VDSGFDRVEDALELVEDALDLVKTSRGQLGTFSHMSDDLESNLAGIRSIMDQVEAFFADRRRVTLTVSTLLLTVLLLDYGRGWLRGYVQWSGTAEAVKGWIALLTHRR